MRYIVTGVDGQLGSRVAANMLDTVPNEELVFTAPDIDRIPLEKRTFWESHGITIVNANYDDPEQLQRAFQGGERLFMVSSIINGPLRVTQHKNVIDAARNSGVHHITYTSFFGANRPGYTQYVLPDHTATEAYLRVSGLDINIMRNNLYLENYLTNAILLANLSDYRWCSNAGESKATFIAKDDSGRVGTALLLGKGEFNADYDVTGRLVSEREICESIARYSGLPYRYTPMDDDTYQSYLDSLSIPRTTDGDYARSPVPFCSNDMVTNEASIAKGLMSIETDTVQKLTGRLPLDFSELIPKYRPVWERQPKTYWDMVRML